MFTKKTDSRLLSGKKKYSTPQGRLVMTYKSSLCVDQSEEFTVPDLDDPEDVNTI